VATDADDELIAELLDAVDGMVAEGELELASRRDNVTIANRLYAQLQREPELDLEEWLVEQDVVVELYLDGDDVAARFAQVLARLRGVEPEPKWNDELAARIAEAPDDVQARIVFGDWLEAAGDPRGELVQIQARRLSHPDDLQLAHREAVFLRRYNSYLLGPLAEYDSTRPTFRFGFIDELEVDPRAFVEAHAHPSLRFLRKLVVRGSVEDLIALAGQLPPRLTSLALRGLHERDPVSLHEVLRNADALEELACDGMTAGLDLAVLRAPRLRSLQLTYHAVTGETWRAALPALERLSLGCYLEREATSALDVLVRPPPHLTALHLSGNYAAQWIRRLVEAPLLNQLSELDLSGAHLDRLQTLLGRHREQFEHLRRIDLRDAQPEGAVAALAQLGPHVLIGTKLTAPPVYPHEPYDEDEDEDEGEEVDEEVESVEADGGEQDDEEDDDGAPPEIDFDGEPPD
jgi:uncharacterized protein (TIGR02996 family)